MPKILQRFPRYIIAISFCVLIVLLSILFLVCYIDTNTTKPNTNIIANGTTTVSKATFVIAANDSKNKEKADFVCDGTDDQIEIQAAINSLSPGGGKIILLDGTYNIDSATNHGDSLNAIHLPHINNGAHITIEGMGGSTILHTRIDAYVFSAVGSGSYEPDANTRLIFRDLTFSTYLNNKGGGIYLEYCSYCLVENCWFYNLASGVTFSSVWKSIITNNWFEGCYQPILLINSHDCSVRGNLEGGFENAGKPSSQVFSIKVIQGFETIITNNSIEHIYDNGKSSIGIWIVDSADTIITSNSIEECDSGLKITGKYPWNSYYLTTSLISTNSFRGNLTNIELSSTSQALIENNLFITLANDIGIKISSGCEKINILSNMFNGFLVGREVEDDGTNTDVFCEFIADKKCY